MQVYIVTWGVTNQTDYLECDSIVHTTYEAAREEFDVLDIDEAVQGALAGAAIAKGWKKCARLERTEALDEHESPAKELAEWVYEGTREVLDQK